MRKTSGRNDPYPSWRHVRQAILSNETGKCRMREILSTEIAMPGIRSPQIEHALPDEAANYSDLQVLQSAAGYYVGTIYTDPDDGFAEPGSRDSEYFPSRKEAEQYLDSLAPKTAGTQCRWDSLLAEGRHEPPADTQREKLAAHPEPDM